MNYVKLCCLVILFPCAVISQIDTKQISFRDLTVDTGLSQNSVVSIAQDSIGYLWFATQDGLNKYDGKTFTFYNKQFEDVTRPTFSKLGKTYIDKSGELWIIANSGLLEKFNSTDNTFKGIKAITDASCIIQNAQKDYFIGTYGNGLFKIEHKTKDTLQIFKQELKGVDIFDFLEVDSKLYIASSTHVFQIENHKIYKIEAENDIINFSTLAISKDESVWVGTFGNGLYYKKKNTDTFKRFEHSQLPENLNIQDLLVDKNNRLWIATYGQGAYLVDSSKEMVTHFLANKNDPFSLHYNDVLCLYQDYTGSIWLGTDGAGLSYYDEHLLKFNLLNNKQVPDQISVDVIRAIAVDENNTMWLGTSGKGLTSANVQEKRFNTYTSENSELLGNRIMSLLYHRDALWIGHQDLGLQRLDSNGSFKWFERTEKYTIWKIYSDVHDNLWLCTRNHGLIRFDETKGIVKTYTSENSALTSDNIRTIEKGDTNTLWIGSEDNGLFKLNTATQNIEKIEAVTDKIKSLYFDGKLVWIGTNGNGLKAYNVIDNSVKTYTIEDYLVNNVIYGILPDDNRNLWLSSNKGITKFNMNDSLRKQTENYSTVSGLQAYEFNTGAYFKDNSGNLYFGGLEGVNWFDPNGFTINEAEPKTVITKFEIFGKVQPMVQNTQFRHNQNTMTFTFAGLHFSHPEQNLYRYKLLNHDAD